MDCLGVWEEKAFGEDDAFLNAADGAIVDMIYLNVTVSILQPKRLACC
ncbi:hypothetical protein [Janthinobacterium sp. HLX7-2]